jgi:glycine/D-amino acid oxidase-like deaminating enzyme
MKRTSFWIGSVPIRRFPVLQKDFNGDVLMVGAGITGITTVYLLKKAALKVILIECDRVASIDTGHTTAHLTYVTDVRLHELAENFGNDHAQAAWDAGAAAIDQSKTSSQRSSSTANSSGYQRTCTSPSMDFPRKIFPLSKETPN